MEGSVMIEGQGNRADRVFKAIRTDILATRLPPSSKLKINTLTDTYAVSLGVVREALSRLVADGLVTAESQKGFRVAPVRRGDLIDLTEARIRIETLCLADALETGDVAWEGEIVSSHHCLRHTPERQPCAPDLLSPDWARAHMRLHDALVAACGNTWMQRIRKTLYEQSERYRWLSVPLGKAKRDVAREHAALVKAALDRDINEITGLIRRHLETTTKIILDSGAIID